MVSNLGSTSEQCLLARGLEGSSLAFQVLGLRSLGLKARRSMSRRKKFPSVELHRRKRENEPLLVVLVQPCINRSINCYLLPVARSSNRTNRVARADAGFAMKLPESAGKPFQLFQVEI